MPDNRAKASETEARMLAGRPPSKAAPVKIDPGALARAQAGRDAVNKLLGQFGARDADAGESDPRKSVKYTIQGTFYNPSSEDKNGSFEETVEGDEMTEDGASTAFYKEHSKNYPHYKIGSIKKVEAEADAKKDSSPRHDDETARAGRAMNTEVISRVADVALKLADRIGARMDADDAMKCGQIGASLAKKYETWQEAKATAISKTSSSQGEAWVKEGFDEAKRREREKASKK